MSRMLGVKQAVDQSRLIIVSNRLPVTIEEKEGRVEYLASSGGLATGLGSLEKGAETLWVGWPGSVSRSQQKIVAETLGAHHGCVPVFLSERLVEKYYEGFSNRTIWPLFHSFQSFARYSASEWQAYQEANQRFLQILDGVVKPGDKVWIHDYQLMLLPGLLRDRYPDLTIGFFLHIPFPSFDVLRLLPQHREILNSLLGSDLLGFHTNDYVRSFLNCIHRAFGAESRLGQILVGGRIVQTITHPMGIDFEKFSAFESLSSDSMGDSLNVEKTFGESEIIFSVSRLDYTKGILQALESFELLLRKRTDLSRKVAFVLCVVPSREKVDRYAHLKREIDEAVGRINARYSDVDWSPIRYLYRHLSFEELIRLYRRAHVALVSPLRDGMNLVAKEYVAARNDEKGVLVLSEMAGAAKELLEAIIVNPNSREEMSEALEQALDMTETEQRNRMRSLRERLLESPVHNWGEEFVRKMEYCALQARSYLRRSLTGNDISAMAAQAGRSKKGLLVLDYDGTLMPLMNNPHSVAPDAQLKEMLFELAEGDRMEVVILSGRSRKDLEIWLSDLPLTLVAEHGAWVKWKGEKSWKSLFDSSSPEWMADVHQALDSFVESIPGSWVEEKERSLVWHYRRAEQGSADVAAKDLVFHLVSLLGEYPVRVVPGNRSIEIRCIQTGKGVFVRQQLNLERFDFVFAAGDDLTDEDLFGALPSSAVSVKVGSGFSKARFRVRDHLELRRVLSEISLSVTVSCQRENVY